MAAQSKNIWGLIWGCPEVDPSNLARAVEEQARRSALDFRTRLLIRDSVEALKDYWGPERLARWLDRCPARDVIEAIRKQELGEPGFPTIRERLMDKTDPERVRQLFRELGSRVRHRLRLAVGGSIALILPGYLERSTTDIDVVDELPAEIRSQHALLDELRKRYGLELAHFQSHYLPSGWDNRLHYLDTYGDLQVYLVDVYDVFLSKLYSIRTKDLDDLRMLLTQLDKETLVRKLKETTGSLQASESLLKRAQDNWYILFGEPLPQ
jgi:hypothetical protein